MKEEGNFIDNDCLTYNDATTCIHTKICMPDCIYLTCPLVCFTWYPNVKVAKYKKKSHNATLDSRK